MSESRATAQEKEEEEDTHDLKKKEVKGKLTFWGVIKEPSSIIKHELFVASPEDSRSCKQVKPQLVSSG